MPRLIFQRLSGLFLAVALTVTLALASAACAQGLSADKIDGFLNSLPEVEALGLQIDDGEGMSALPRVMEGEPFSAGVELITSSGQRGQLQTISDNHGFADLAEWSDTGDRVFRAAVAMEIPDQLEEMDAQLEEAKAQIMAAESLSQSQKDEMINAFGRMRNALQAIVDRADPADMAAVEPFMPRLRQAME